MNRNDKQVQRTTPTQTQLYHNAINSTCARVQARAKTGETMTTTLKQLSKKILIALIAAFCFGAEAQAGLEVVNGATFTVTNDAVLETSGSIVLNGGGVIDASGATPGKIRLSGNWNNLNGVFTHGASSVTFFDAAGSSITGNTTFYVLSCQVPGKTLYFQQGSTQGIANLLNLTGTIGNEILLKPTANNTTWYVRTLSSQTVHFVNVQNSSALPNIITTKFSIDAGGNNNFWIFDEIGVLILGSTSYDFGLWDLSSSTVSASSFTVQNIGNVLEDFKMYADTVTLATPWALSTAQGTDQFVLKAGFSPTRPNLGDFGSEDTLRYFEQIPDATQFAIGASSGTGVPVDERRYLWMRLDTPLLTSTTDQQRIQVILSGRKTPQ